LSTKPGSLPFDHVVVQTSDGSKRLTVSEFLAIALTERVRALLEKRVAFYQDQTRLDASEALRALRERA
jgi:hypothetical protein